MTATLVAPAPAPAHPGSPPGGARHLVVLDLSCSPGARRILRRLIGGWLRASARLGGAAARPGGVAILVYAPSGDAQALDLPPTVRVITPDETLSAEETDAVHEWAYDASIEITRGSGRAMFPEVAGLNLGDLNLGQLQSGLRNYGLLAAAASAALRASGTRRCTIVSLAGPMGAALRREVVGLVPRVRALRPPQSSWTRRTLALVRAVRGSRATTAAADAPAPVVPEAGEPARALIVAESAAIVEMFEPVDARLQEIGVAPLARVQYGPPRRPGGELALRLPEPETVAGPAQRERAAELWRRARSAVAAFDVRRALGGVGYSPPLDAFLGPIFARFAPQLAFPAHVAPVLDALRPRVLVVGNDRLWSGQMWVRLARARGIATMCVQDGVEGAVPNWYWMTADVLAASGDRLPRQLAAHGTPASRCVVTGQPRYDRLYAPGAAARAAAARERLEIDANAPCVLFAAQPRHDAWYQRQVINAVLAAPGAVLVIRPHPRGPAIDYATFVPAGAETRVRIERKGSIYDLLDVADVLVTQYSTTAIEAAILGIPVISADFTGAHEITGFVSSGIAELARTAAELATLVAAHAARGPRRIDDTPAPAPAAVREFNGPADGRATERVAELVRSLAERDAPTGD
jgi:hypothetical protein